MSKQFLLLAKGANRVNMFTNKAQLILSLAFITGILLSAYMSNKLQETLSTEERWKVYFLTVKCLDKRSLSKIIKKKILANILKYQY